MNERQQQIVKSVDLHRQLILDAERWLWAVYPSIAAYFEAIDKLFLDKDAVIYHDDGSITVDLTN